MKKRFILLIDFSENSVNLIKYATDWSLHENAELILVHKTIVLAPALADNKSREQLARYARNDALNKLKNLAEVLIPTNIKVSFSVSENDLLSTLEKLISEPYEQLIFTGIKGTGLFKKIFLGSVALEVINESNNIVVAMPDSVTTFSPGKIFVAVSLRHRLNLIELNKILKFFGSERKNITFFHLARPNEQVRGIEKYLQELKALYEANNNSDYIIYEGSKPFEDIKKVINNKIEEVLIVQKGSRLLNDQLFRRFLINDLIYEGQTPLIVLP